MFLNLVSRFISILGVFTLFLIVLVIIKSCIHDFIDLVKYNHFVEEEICSKDETNIEFFGDEL